MWSSWQTYRWMLSEEYFLLQSFNHYLEVLYYRSHKFRWQVVLIFSVLLNTLEFILNFSASGQECIVNSQSPLLPTLWCPVKFLYISCLRPSPKASELFYTGYSPTMTKVLISSAIVVLDLAACRILLIAFKWLWKCNHVD